MSSLSVLPKKSHSSGDFEVNDYTTYYQAKTYADHIYDVSAHHMMRHKQELEICPQFVDEDLFDFICYSCNRMYSSLKLRQYTAVKTDRFDNQTFYDVCDLVCKRCLAHHLVSGHRPCNIDSKRHGAISTPLIMSVISRLEREKEIARLYAYYSEF